MPVLLFAFDIELELLFKLLDTVGAYSLTVKINDIIGITAENT